MTHTEFFKLQAKNLFRDYQTKTKVFDKEFNNYFYEYNPKYFDIVGILLYFDFDEDDFSLMKAQHLIAQMVGFRTWAELVNASEPGLKLAKLLFDNQERVSLDDWQMYIIGAETDNNTTFDPDTRLEIFKLVFLDERYERLVLSDNFPLKG